MINPAVLFPPETYHVIGPFKFPVYKDLAPAESRAINAVLKEQTQGSTQAIGIARRIAHDKGISVKEAMERLRDLKSEENADLLYEYLDEIQELNQGADAEEGRNQVVTIVMQMRGSMVSPENDGTYTRTETWDSTDTDVVPSKLLNEIFQYIMWERDGWPTSGNEPSEEAPPPSPTKTSMKSTKEA